MITVLLPVYNASSYIREAIASILNQTFSNFELLIIDDGSTDDTVKIIRSFNDERINLHINAFNIGIGNTLNYGLTIAKNNLIARFDGDDISLPDRLEKQYKFMMNNSSVDVLSTQYAVMNDRKILYTVKTGEHHCDIKKRLVLHSEILHSGVMYRKDIILKYGGYKDIYIEDYELWLRIKEKIIFHNLPEILLIMRYHANSASLQIERKNASIYESSGFYYDNLQKEFGIDNKYENIFRGWREYFYGDKNLARKYFIKSFTGFIKSPRAITAYFTTFLSKDLFVKFKEIRLRFRIIYLLKYFSKENRFLRKFLKRNKI